MGRIDRPVDRANFEICDFDLNFKRQIFFDKISDFSPFFFPLIRRKSSLKPRLDR